ncbi:nuclear transport factor 2 family protein [Sphingosinicella sp. BN140058]|uniref:YybH family protein n=1 Tax=Sphingosinicella sp. BN140058 TaxID=1892855 RepID=UPI001010D371|nr:nuclear transport factor 2 family protein [Sphingosinicella sp. BN140058]QAY76001.1 nuclear transport factor 2 family protein [Sphingosinicella sp. BN140058]
MSSKSLVAAAAGAATLAACTSPSASDRPQALLAEEVARLAADTAEANAALMRGDVDRHRAIVALSDDFTLMSPFGGSPSRGRDLTREDWDRIGRFFRNGTFEQELVESYATDGMIVLVLIERTHVQVGGLPAQPWALRVTLVYTRAGDRWQLAHRHADPLANGLDLAAAASLARGTAE